MATWSLEGRTATGGNRSLLRIVDANSKVVRVTPTEVQLSLPDQERVTVATLSGAPRRDRNLVLERMLDGSCVLKVDEGEPIPLPELDLPLSLETVDGMRLMNGVFASGPPLYRRLHSGR